MDSLNKSNSASADGCSTKNKRRNGKCSPASEAVQGRSHDLNFRRFLFPSCFVALLVVAIYMLLLKITPPDRNVMAQIRGRNLTELNENGCFRERNSDTNVSSSDSESDDDVLSAFDEMDLGENEEKDLLDADENVEEKYKGENDFCNVYSSRFEEGEMIFTSDVTEDELDELINNMEEFPSKNEIIKMWKRAYALEVQTIYKMLIALFEYSEELKDKHQVKEKLAFTHWDSVMSSCLDILTEREQHYSELFDAFIMKDDLTREEFVNFLNNCKMEVAEMRESLETFAKKEFDARIIPERGN
ncbi:hypothetical protein C922_05506 [Plasmodium inui San Antonio 1]|uniref:Plasmodium RESA N-terminal domain-containing protein n=1 Tax=Plasmodium inui San Antonio 1 TaxID=1237626 RepID=W6ZXX2_9APIC|nr:hypothetical protein C922_05506 [Plasmodium inui San Antonio 1]EUD64115.1 hypothetical protein C922_05506 [Plasmodium inui San Antonio 1]